jgi:4-hydroxy-3-polyprenylbenzoate decarboxylase
MKRWVVGISGATGAVYAKRLLEVLAETATSQALQVEVAASANGLQIYRQETGAALADMPFRVFAQNDFSAPFASGSASHEGMVVVPCSGGTLGRIASGASDSLLTRAAEVMLKERRKLILVFRESPFSLVHIENMAAVTRAGATVMPASPVFYAGAASAQDLIDTVVARILKHMDIEQRLMKEWGR